MSSSISELFNIDGRRSSRAYSTSLRYLIKPLRDEIMHLPFHDRRILLMWYCLISLREWRSQEHEARRWNISKIIFLLPHASSRNASHLRRREKLTWVLIASVWSFVGGERYFGGEKARSYSALLAPKIPYAVPQYSEKMLPESTAISPSFRRDL